MAAKVKNRTSTVVIILLSVILQVRNLYERSD